MASNNTTAPPALSSSVSMFDLVIESLASTLNTFYTPTLVFLGCIGNLLSMYVFYASKLRMQSTSLYLSVLAASDTVFLLQLLPPWLNAMSYTNLFHRWGFCQFFVYSTYVSCSLSGWIVVSFTLERFVAVLYPLQRNSMCTVARAKSVICLLLLMSMITNLPVIKYSASSKNDCNIDSKYVKHAARFNLADTVVSFWMPMGFIIVLNIGIMYGVARRERARRMAVQPEPGCGARALPPLRMQQRITKMLFIVSTVFVVLNLPAYTMRVLAYSFNWSAGDYSGRWAALQTLALAFFNTNFGINFILYCLSGQNFRRELCLSIPCLRRCVRRNNDMQIGRRNAVRIRSVSTSCISATEAMSTGRNCEAPSRPGRNCEAPSRPDRNSEAPSRPGRNCEAPSRPGRNCEAPSRSRRHRSEPEPFIERWTFNNSRPERTAPQPSSQAVVEEIEMQDLSHVRYSQAPTISRQNERTEAPFMFPLFPMGRLLVPRGKSSSSVSHDVPST